MFARHHPQLAPSVASEYLTMISHNLDTLLLLLLLLLLLYMHRLEWHYRKNMLHIQSLWRIHSYSTNVSIHVRSSPKTPWTVAFSAVVWAPYTMTTSWQSPGERSRRVQQPQSANDAFARSPSVIRWVDGTSSADVELERRRLRDSTLDVSWRVSARYDGAVPWRQR